MRAAEILGGIGTLASHLKVPQETVLRWIRGEETPPTEPFMEVVDLLLEHDMGRFGTSGKAPESPER